MAPIAERFSPTQLRKRPFELIFGTIGPMLMPGLLGKAFALYLEHIGYGPGLLGKLIDDALGFNKTPDVSEANVYNASKEVASKLGLTKLVGAELKKEAVRPGQSGGAPGFLSRLLRGQRTSPIDYIYFLISKYLKGILALSVMSGVVGATTGKPQTKKEKSEYWVPGTPMRYTEEKSELFNALKGVL